MLMMVSKGEGEKEEGKEEAGEGPARLPKEGRPSFSQTTAHTQKRY